MHSINPNEVLSLHTQSALNHLNSSAFLTHSECTQSTQMKCYLLTHSEYIQSTQIKCSPYTLRMHSINPNEVLSPYTLRMHSTNSNEVLSFQTQSTLNQLNSSAFLARSKCTQSTQIKTYNAGIWTHAHPMLQNTTKEHQSSTCAPPNSRWPPKFFKTPPRLQKRLQEPSRTETCTSKEHQSKSCAPPNSKWPPNPQCSSKALQNSSKPPKVLQPVQTCTSNTHKPSRYLSQAHKQSDL